MMNSNAAQNWQGRMLGRYRLLNLFGHEGRGDLWLAEDSQLRRQVTIKILPMRPHADQQWLFAFDRELHAAASMDHPHILPIHDFGQQSIDAGQIIAYLVTPFINGGTLLDRLGKTNGPLQPIEALAFLRQAGQAIDYAHSKHILHGDVTPASMFLQNDWLYLADFGLARLFPNISYTSHPPVTGTPEYVAPEQIEGRAEPASDRYSLAVCAYQLLTGRLPFSGDASIVLQKQAQELPPRPRQFNAAIPLLIEQALMWGLAKRPSDRPSTCKALVDALEGHWLQNNAARIDGEGTYLAPWSKRQSEQPASALSGPVSPAAMTYANNVPDTANAPTYLSNPANTPNVTPVPAPLYAPSATNIPTYISNIPATPALPATSPATRHRLSRRALLIGSAGAAALAVVGGTALIYTLRNGTITGSPPHPQATPTPALGPHKLIAGVPVLSLTGHSKTVEQVIWDASGRYLATGSEDTHVMLWDLGSILKNGSTTFQSLATPLRNWKLPKTVQANCLCWSADGHTLAAVTLDQNIYTINTASSAPPTILNDASQQNNFITPFYANIAWSPTGSYFATNDLNSFKTQLGLWQYGHAKSPVQTLTFSDANSGQLGAEMDFISWSSDGKLLASHTNFGEVAIWDITTKRVTQVIKMADRPQFNKVIISNECLAWSPTEQVLAASDFDLTYIWDVKHNKHLLTLQVNEPLLKDDIHPPYVWNMTWSPSGRYLALCYPRSPRIYVWDIQTLRATPSPTKPITQTLLFPQKTINNGAAIDIAWSPDGRYIAAGYGDSTVIIWKVDGS